MNIRYLLSLLLVALLVSCKEYDLITVYNDSVSVEAEGGAFTLCVTSDAEINPVYPEWITLEETIANNGQYAFTFSASTYFSNQGRRGEIYFHGTAQQRMVKVIQEKMKAYVPSEDFSGFGDLNDIQLKIIDGWIKHGNNSGGFNETTGPNIALMWDGIKGQNTSMCNSPWNAKYFGGSSGDELAKKMLALFPHELKFTLEQGTERVDYMMYYPRPSKGGGVFGVITEVLVSTYDDPNTFVSVAKGYDCGMESTIRTIYFNKPIYKPHTVWVKIGSGKDNFISCTEMEFFGKSSNSFDYKTLFKDELCTELKDNITLTEIETCPYPFFKNLAQYMYYDCYDTSFRVASFKAWEHPSKAAARNKTTPYSLVDNPTGIYVKKGEKIVTMVGEIHNQSASLMVVNLDIPNGDGFNSTNEYPLKPGVNMHTMKDKGLIYVQYHTDAYQAVEPIRMHFMTGQVNGYFDLYNDDHNKLEDWSDLLANNSSLYLDVLGKYSHLIFPVNNLKKVGDPIELIKFYDNLVYEEQKLMGLVKYDKMFTNRMCFSTMYTSYMYSTSYRTSYNVTTLDNLCDLVQVKADPWGPAHEVGHSNQTSPVLKWTGMTEVTNNIHSMNIRRMTSGDSRLEIKGYYPHAMTTAFTGRPHITVGKLEGKGVADVFCQLVPFWQLQMYLSYVLGKEDFFADVHEAARLSDPAEDKKKTAGEHQLEFAYICSQKAGLDLTEFFEKWGFLREVNTTITDYGVVGVFNIDVNKLNSLKSRIANLNLPKPRHNFWYITEKTEKIFKENRSMNTSGVVVNVDRLANSIAISGCINAVAYEVYDKESGKLIFVSPAESSFVVDNTISLPKKIQIRAIPASGEALVVYSE